MLRLMLCLTMLLGRPAWADCTGTDLISTLPPDELAALRKTANAAPHANGILWRAEGEGRTLHLVGTLHVPDARHDATMDRIAPFLDGADAVLLELGDGDEARLQRMIAEDPGLAFITDGPTLPDLLPEATWTALRAALADRGVPGFMAAKMKPWMAMANLGFSACDMDNLRQGLRGLDGQIIDRAAALGKPATGLEPIDTALRLFAAFSEAEQIEMLELGLAQQGADPHDQGTTVAEAYFREEIALIWEWTVAQSFAVPGIAPDIVQSQIDRMNEALVAARNRQWVGHILATPGDLLIAVGALHLPGEAGVLRLLENEGYTVTRLPLAP